uniref:Uncharacterized protein n=1 Tax=Saimiri boliviensis boliviensis TaxID=39432 RepID=A0A2K6SK31_SAIBB
MPGGGGLIPGGGIPIGVPRAGGSPIGGPMGGLIPGGGAIISLPGGGVALPTGGGGVPRPGGYCVGAPAMLAVAATAAAATVPLPWPANPAGAWGIGTPAGTPRPAALPTPGPPAAPASGTRAISALPYIFLTSLGGGPSTVMDTRFSPRSSTRPKTRFSSLTLGNPLIHLWPSLAIASVSNPIHPHQPYLIFLNSSQSQRIKFICLSKALKVPMKIRPSCRMHLIL